VKVHVNGRETEVRAGSTVADLIAELGLTGRRVAVEINRDVVARDSWPMRRVAESDQVEVVQFVGGG
jgi:thiamine biosynthesis protein ThiS